MYFNGSSFVTFDGKSSAAFDFGLDDFGVEATIRFSSVATMIIATMRNQTNSTEPSFWSVYVFMGKAVFRINNIILASTVIITMASGIRYRHNGEMANVRCLSTACLKRVQRAKSRSLLACHSLYWRSCSESANAVPMQQIYARGNLDDMHDASIDIPSAPNNNTHYANAAIALSNNQYTNPVFASIADDVNSIFGSGDIEMNTYIQIFIIAILAHLHDRCRRRFRAPTWPRISRANVPTALHSIYIDSHQLCLHE